MTDELSKSRPPIRTSPRFQPHRDRGRNFGGTSGGKLLTATYRLDGTDQEYAERLMIESAHGPVDSEDVPARAAESGGDKAELAKRILAGS